MSSVSHRYTQMTQMTQIRYRCNLCYWYALLAITLILSPIFTQAQEKTYDEALEILLEDLFTPQDDGVDYEEQYEILAQWYAHPINLNQATAEDLQQLYVLSERQIDNLLRQRELYGDFMTLNELLYIPAWDQATIFKILPFVVAEPKPDRAPTWSERLADADHLFIVRDETTLERKAGYLRADTLDSGHEQQYYPGSPHKLYTRWRMSRRNDFSVGITAEKDAGEMLRWQPGGDHYGMDYYAAHAQIENRGWLRQLTLGDYRVQAGQGLLLGSGFAVGKGAEPVRTVARTQQAVRPHTAATENGFFRGLSATVRLPSARHTWELMTLVSSQRQDARIDSVTAQLRCHSDQRTTPHRQ